MMACRLAIRETPIANMIVTAAGNPSGIAPTAKATATLNVYSQSLPRSISSRKIAAAKAMITTQRMRLRSLIFRIRGVSSTSVPAISSEIWPISLRSPVATTTPVPTP